jgi:prephenate dehydrogenase
VMPHLVVTGVGRQLSSLQTAKTMGVIEHASTDMAASVASADVVLLGVPVGAIHSTLQHIAPHLQEGALVMDVGSTKADVVAMAQATLGKHLPNFVAAHPIAGKECSGVAHATAALYKHHRVILTPTAVTHAAALERADALWAACGAHVHTMDATEHDRVFAAVSHLPHLLAFAYMNGVADDQTLALAGPGFRDFTRIAASSPDVWRDIFVANREPLLAQLAQFEMALAHLKSLVQVQVSDASDGNQADHNHQALYDNIAQASARRTNWQPNRPD